MQSIGRARVHAWRVAHISSFPTEAGAPRLAFETWDQTSRDIGQLRQPSIPEGPAFTRAIIDASAGRFRSAEGRSGARSAERPNCRPPSRHKSPPLSFPQNPQQIRMSTPSTLQNPPNPHPINHFPPKNTWHSSYAPTRRIKVGEKKGGSRPAPCNTILPNNAFVFLLMTYNPF
jgi:hypothetical protein